MGHVLSTRGTRACFHARPQADAVLTGLDRRPKAVAKARQTVAKSARVAAIVEGDAMALPFDNGSMDTVVFSFSLCGVPEVRGALVEALRVLRPGGALLMAERLGRGAIERLHAAKPR